MVGAAPRAARGLSAGKPAPGTGVPASPSLAPSPLRGISAPPSAAPGGGEEARKRPPLPSIPLPVPVRPGAPLCAPLTCQFTSHLEPMGVQAGTSAPFPAQARAGPGRQSVLKRRAEGGCPGKRRDRDWRGRRGGHSGRGRPGAVKPPI